MAEPEHAQDHGEHFARDGNGDQQQAREVAECVVDEDLADGAAGGEAEDGIAHGRVAADEGRGGEEFVRGTRGEAQGGPEWG